jgi:class 3 adenylate cyclase/tetratricopeptide (TPR) repeat protein
VAELGTSAEARLSRLLERLLSSAEAALRAGDLEPAGATAEEVRAVDPGNERAAAILRQIAAHKVGPWGERALMTLLFSDLVESTRLSEQVEPEQMRDLFTFYRAAARESVERYSGSLIQFSGDGVLAGFGHPEPHEDDARRAVLAGLDLVVAMRDGRAELQRRIGASAEVRVGIHTGRVVITDLRRDAAVSTRDSILGITPNLAARIQGAGEPGTVVISDVTQQLVDADFFMRSLGEHELKGITRSVEIFAVDRPRYAAARFTADRYRRAGLVGREEPADRLVTAWRTLTERPEHPGAVFLVTGEAGIGKSRLVVELLDRVQCSGGEVLGAGCLPYYANVPLWPLARMLERALGIADRPDKGAVALSALERHLGSLGLEAATFVPFLGSLLSRTDTSGYPTPELDPSAFREVTLARLVDWMSALADRTPHLFVVEDLHWADPSTLELLRLVAERRPAALFTVATTREPDGVPWRDEVEVVELRRLDDVAAKRLVGNLTAGKELTDDHLVEIVEQAVGNPLFIEELTRSRLAETSTEPIPLRLQELFTWRLKSPDLDLRVVQVAATIGPAFRGSTVSAVFGDEGAVEAQLVLLVDQGIVEPAATAGTYRFRHALMRDAAYETQVLDVRRSTHAAVADVMIATGREPALVAQHLDLAGLDVRAASSYVVAAQASQARGAHTEATQLLSRALELYEAMPASQDRDLGELGARMLRVFSVSSMRGYAAPEVESDHDRAQTLVEGLGDRPEVLPSVVGIYAYRLTNGDVPTAHHLTERLLAMTSRPEFSWFQPEVDDCAGFAQLYQGHLESAQGYFERSVAGFEARPSEEDVVSPYWPLPNDPVAAAKIGLACIATLRADPEAAARHEREAIRRAEAIGFPRGPFTVGFVKTYAAWIRQFRGEDEAARRLAGEVVAVGEKHGYAYWVVLGSAYLAGPPDGAPDPTFLENTVGTLRLMGHEAFLASVLASLARMTARTGDVERSYEQLNDAFQVAHKTGEMLHVPEILRQRAAISRMRDADSEEAVADLVAAVEVATEQGARVSRLRAALDLARLPDEQRPENWTSILAAARRDLPEAYTSTETEAADLLLDG